MIKFLRRTLVIGVLTTVILSNAIAQSLILGFLPTGSYNGAMLVVTARPLGATMACGVLGDAYSVVVIRLTGGAPSMTVLVVAPGTDIKPGDRFNLSNQSPCSGDHMTVNLTPLDNAP